MRVFLAGQTRFRYTQRVKRALTHALETEHGGRVDQATFHYTEVEPFRADLQGRVIFKDGRIYHFYGTFSVDDGITLIWEDKIGDQLSIDC